MEGEENGTKWPLPRRGGKKVELSPLKGHHVITSKGARAFKNRKGSGRVFVGVFFCRSSDWREESSAITNRRTDKKQPSRTDFP